MTKEKIQQKIVELGPWYQGINLDGIVTDKKRNCEETWKLIESSFNLNFNRVLDLGCNAGYYSIMLANKGIKVTGIEYFKKAYDQALFVKEYFEEKLSRRLDIQYVNNDISDLNLLSFGKFDCIFALSILYHIGNFKYGKGSKESFIEQDRVILELTQLSNKILVRARERKRIKNESYNPSYYNKVFKKFNFFPVKTIVENKQGRSLILYEKINDI